MIMRKILYFLLLIISTENYSQANFILKTQEGRSILLKSDNTWEYLDVKKVKSDSLNKLVCNLGDNYKEPVLNSRVQSLLKRGKSSIIYIKRRVAKEFSCSVTDVILTRVSEQKERGVYYFCVQGKKVKYKRIGNAILKAKKVFRKK